VAQYETHLTGDFYALLHYIEKNVMQGSATASREGGSTFEADGVRCAVRVYERYSWWGGNRLSLCVTLFGKGKELHLSAITSGGSQALFFKVNTLGEEAFLNRFVRGIEEFKQKNDA